MIETLALHNFKSWRDLDMELGKVTGLFGANSSGKSSLLQFLLMLKQTKNATDLGLVVDLGGSNSLVNLGTFRDVVHRHDEDASIQWSIGWTLQRGLRIGGSFDARTWLGRPGDRVHLECSIGLQRDVLSAHWLKYQVREDNVSLEPLPGVPSQFQLVSGSPEFQFELNQRFQDRDYDRPIPGPVKTHLFPGEVRIRYQNTVILSALANQYERMIDGIYYLGPLREYPQRVYVWGGASPEDVGQRGERIMDAILAATARGGSQFRVDDVGTIRSLQEVVAYWLKELRLIESFVIREIAPGTNLYQALVKRDQSSAEVLLTDVGFGVSQVLPVVVLLAYVPEGSTVLLEQPEIHLHPSVQSGLADYILWAARRRNVQVIVESHSEHMLRRFQRRVAEEAASSQDVKLYFASMEGGEARLRDLELNQWGEIQNWPDNFFGDELGELSAIARNSLQRKLGNRDGDT